MIYPDEIPVWLAIPSLVVTWGTWISICVLDARARRRQTQGSRR
ncbi:hypothetical protein [Microbacterium sp. AG238]|nr:hypothetical protein [Microbacterium sp. AG238]RKE60435.1 hypothetical protein DEU36_2876 [Microbacterium sp. AG238]